eukprot:2665973-Prymnesium_polylepis.1
MALWLTDCAQSEIRAGEIAGGHANLPVKRSETEVKPSLLWGRVAQRRVGTLLPSPRELAF